MVSHPRKQLNKDGYVLSVCRPLLNKQKQKKTLKVIAKYLKS